MAISLRASPARISSLLLDHVIRDCGLIIVVTLRWIFKSPSCSVSNLTASATMDRGLVLSCESVVEAAEDAGVPAAPA